MEEKTMAKITPYQKKPLSDSTLRGMKKDELIGVLRDYEHNYSVLYEQYQNSVAASEKIIKDLTDAGGRSAAQWINVKDKVPEADCKVLAYYGFDRGDGDLGIMFYGVLDYYAFDEKPHFQHASTGLTVTHWMPLPEPPEERKEVGGNG